MKTVAEFSIPYHQFLDAVGRHTGRLPDFAQDHAQLLKMYRLMTLVRAFDTKCVNLQRTGKLGTYPSCLGHEAVHVGVGAAMQPDDVMFPVYREFGTQLWRGVKMSNILLYWAGDERGSDFGSSPPDFPWCIPIASQTLHAAGVAMAMKIRNEPRCAVAYIGDGGTSQGAFYEAMNVAGAQALPVVFMVVNNGWAISVPLEVQTAAQTLAQKAVAAGIPGVQVDGNDILAVRHVVGEALAKARRGAGPTVIEALTYRLSDHTTADDASRYRPDQQVKDAWRTEPLLRFRAYLTQIGAWDETREADLKAACTREIEAAVEEYLRTPHPSSDSMFDFLFANLPRNLIEQRASARRLSQGGGSSCERACEARENTGRIFPSPRGTGLTGGASQALSHEPPPASTPPITMIEAINKAHAWEMSHDPNVVVLGQDVGVNGGVFRATTALQDKFGKNRVHDTPLAEGMIAGLALGMASQGLRPVAEIQFMGFIYPAMDQIANHMARMRSRTRGRITLPLVLRMPHGGGIHAPEHHSESLEAMLAHHPGLRVVCPSSPARAYGLLLAAIRDPDPVLFLEPVRLYRLSRQEVADNGEALPLDKCFRLRAGHDVTIVTWGAMAFDVLRAAEQLEQEGVSCEVIDLATLSPIDHDTLLESVGKTGRLVIVHEAPRNCGIGAEIAATVAERGLYDLHAPIRRVTGYDTIMPLFRLEQQYIPSVARIVDAVRETLAD